MAKNTSNPANTGSAAATTETTAEVPAKRERLAVSKEKKLAYMVLSLVAIFQTKAVAATLTEEQQTKVKEAKTKAEELRGGDVLKPVTDRIAAITVELKAIDYAKDPAGAAAQAKELAVELDKQIKRKATIEEMIAG